MHEWVSSNYTWVLGELKQKILSFVREVTLLIFLTSYLFNALHNIWTYYLYNEYL